ncbi:MAG: FAD:protein FMN transferase, partial [Bacillota bacterium]
MGTIASQEVYGIHGPAVLERAGRELHRLDALWSPCRPGNIVDVIRRAAGREMVTVDADTLQVLRMAKALGLSARGAFDITSDPLIRLWRRALGSGVPPHRHEIEELLPLVGTNHLKLKSRSTVYLPYRGQGVDLGGIGKGFAADRLRQIYCDAGIRHAAINIGGNVLVMNRKPDGTPWRIGIKDPGDPGNRLLGYVEVEDCSVVTSGAYEQCFEHTDPAGIPRRFHHIVDPRTGWPAESGLEGVTVVSSSSV